jgi:uncharacterized protein YqjF (DUF2071 family)
VQFIAQSLIVWRLSRRFGDCRGCRKGKRLARFGKRLDGCAAFFIRAAKPIKKPNPTGATASNRYRKPIVASRRQSNVNVRDVGSWPLASFRTQALNDRSWSNNGHRAAQARNPSVAFDPKATSAAADCCYATWFLLFTHAHLHHAQTSWRQPARKEPSPGAAASNRMDSSTSSANGTER